MAAPLAAEAYGWTLPLWTGDLRLQSIFLLLCLAAVALLCRRVFARGCVLLSEKRCSCELLASLAALAAMGDCVAALLAAPEVARLKTIRHHPGVSCYEHSAFVSYVAWRLARRWGADGALAARAGLLHDLYLYDPRSLPSWRQCFAHPVAAARNAAALEGALSPKEENCILAHMWPLSVRAPHSREAAAVCLADKLCSVAEVLHVWRRLALRRAMLSLVR